MLKSLKLLATTALVAAVPLSSSFAGMYATGAASGLFTKQQDHTVHLNVPTGSSPTTTVSGASGTVPVGDYGIKFKSKSTFGVGGVAGVGYSMGDENSSSVSVRAGYDWFGAYELEEANGTKVTADDQEIYSETAVYGVVRATLPIALGSDIVPYAAIEVGAAYKMADDSDMDAALAAQEIAPFPGSTCATGSTCPGLGNFKSDDKKTDILGIAGGAVGVQYTMSPGMSITGEYSVHFGFKKVKFEHEDNEKTYLERDYLKQRLSVGMRYQF